VANKPSFRSAFKSRRCLIPADGFFEWQKTGSKKQSYYVTLQDGGPFAFTGIWERWHGEEGVVQSCSIVNVRSRDVSPSWANCAVELTEAVALLAILSAVRFNALVDQTSIRSTRAIRLPLRLIEVEPPVQPTTPAAWG
jgi:putative SOS response-associated peptidase YedK